MRSTRPVTAVVPVWGESAYLGDLIRSLRAQTLAPEIVAVSSKCGPESDRLLAEHGIELRRHDLASIGSDWNHALGAAETDLCFIAHQDDVYAPTYCQSMTGLFESSPDATIGWCDYQVDTEIDSTMGRQLPRLKRLMNEVLVAGSTSLRSRRARRWVNAFGPVIGCPTVMFNRPQLGDFNFDNKLQVNLDWDAWYRLAERPGSFVRSRERLVTIRVHGQAESAQAKGSGVRAAEDRALLERHWPKPVAAVLAAALRQAY